MDVAPFDRRRLARYVGRFGLLHLGAYVLVGGLALGLVSNLPSADASAIAFFQPYRLTGGALLTEALRAVVLALVFSPFYRVVTRSTWGWSALFLPLWGLTIVGSIDPMPGSIEGVIYTTTPAGAHLFVLAATAVQYGLLVGVLRWWEMRDPILADRPPLEGEDWPAPTTPGFWGYLTRFSLLYVVAYLAAGLTFWVLQDYETVLPAQAAFAMWRPLDHPFVQFAVVFQVGRGAMLGLLVFPLFGRLFSGAQGWLTLFGVLWGATFLGAPATVGNLVTDLLSPGPLTDMLLGTSEVTAQMLGFALVFWAWQGRVMERRGVVMRIVERVRG